MKELASRLFVLFIHLGGIGQFALGVLDSSFLVMPLGNDLLMIAMTVNKPGLMLYYAAMATAGSVLGCLLMDVISRKGGEKALERHVSKKRLKYVENKVKKNAGWALAVASLAPPPFPFTPFVIVSAALNYPRKKLLSVIAVTRFLRFAIEGGLALLFGKRILHWASSPEFQFAMLLLIAGSILASVISVYGWIKKSKTAGGSPRNRRPRGPRPTSSGKFDPAYQREET